MRHSCFNILRMCERCDVTMCRVVAHEKVRVLPPEVIEMRRSLSKLARGDEVLARWSDEGWYYQGTHNIPNYRSHRLLLRNT